MISASCSIKQRVPAVVGQRRDLAHAARGDGRRLPVVATAVEAMAKSGLTADRGCGPAGDDAAMAAGVAALLDDPTRAQLMGVAGRERVRLHYGIETMASAYAALYSAPRP